MEVRTLFRFPESSLIYVFRFNNLSSERIWTLIPLKFSSIKIVIKHVTTGLYSRIRWFVYSIIFLLSIFTLFAFPCLMFFFLLYCKLSISFTEWTVFFYYEISLFLNHLTLTITYYTWELHYLFSMCSVERFATRY